MPTAATRGRSSRARGNGFWRASTSRSSSGRVKPQASSRCPSAGSSSAHSLGSAAADDWPRTGNASTTRRSPSSASPPSASCCENCVIPNDVLGQTLRLVAYLDPVQIPTIGYGTIQYPNGRKVALGDSITEEQAEAFLKFECEKIAKDIL